MEVNLLSDVDKVGLRGEVVDVARGYARNFLLPRRLAEPATPARVAELRKREEQRARHEARTVEQGREIAEVNRKFQGAELTVLRSIEMNLNPRGEGDMDPKSLARLDLEKSKVGALSPAAHR